MDNGNLSAKKFWMDKINRIGQNKWFCQFVADPINLSRVLKKSIGKLKRQILKVNEKASAVKSWNDKTKSKGQSLMNVEKAYQSPERTKSIE